MKLMFVLCFIALVGLSMADRKTHPRGCIYIMGRCARECEVGTHAYTTGCSYLQPEPTCDNPTPELDTSGILCDFSACYCDAPTVRDTATNKCVRYEECSSNEKI